MERESMEYDVVIVGAGLPAVGAIRLRQLSAEHGRDLSVCVLRKARKLAPIFCPGPSWSHER